MRALLLIALVALLPLPALAQLQSLKPAAKAKLDKGMKYASEKRYDEAIKELRSGYSMSEAREFLYAMGQVERLRGNCRTALVHYQAFLDASPAPDQVNAAKVQMDRCEAELKPAAPVEAPKEAVVTEPAKPADVPPAQPEPKPAPVVATAEDAVKAPPPEVKVQAKPWYTDALGDVLLASGVAVAAGGAVVFAMGNSSAKNSTTNLDAWSSAQGQSWMQPVGIAMMGAGGALVVGAIVRYATMGSGESTTAVGFAPSQGGGQLVLSGRF
jgi:tetratricopeptide (TPR) repeat protein